MQLKHHRSAHCFVMLTSEASHAKGGVISMLVRAWSIIPNASAASTRSNVVGKQKTFPCRYLEGASGLHIAKHQVAFSCSMLMWINTEDIVVVAAKRSHKVRCQKIGHHMADSVQASFTNLSGSMVIRRRMPSSLFNSKCVSSR